jgi:hypothetical protein
VRLDAGQPAKSIVVVAVAAEIVVVTVTVVVVGVGLPTISRVMGGLDRQHLRVRAFFRYGTGYTTTYTASNK